MNRKQIKEILNKTDMVRFSCTPEEKAAAAEKDFESKIREENSKQINPMEMWLRRYGTIDKDKIAEETEERDREQDRSFLISMKPEARIDLHGLHLDEAETRLNDFITIYNVRILN